MRDFPEGLSLTTAEDAPAALRITDAQDIPWLTFDSLTTTREREDPDRWLIDIIRTTVDALGIHYGYTDDGTEYALSDPEAVHKLLAHTV